MRRGRSWRARQCGIRATYRAGCRCAECKAAQNSYMREYQARRGGNLNRNPATDRAYRERIGSSRERYPEVHRRNDQIRRARRLAAEIERFDDAEVFERDAWVCGICSGPVDQALRYPDPLSPSLDHIVPLSLLGAHTRENTRLAHLICNTKRGNRVA